MCDRRWQSKVRPLYFELYILYCSRHITPYCTVLWPLLCMQVDAEGPLHIQDIYIGS